MIKVEAEQIALAVSTIRPDWLKTSLVTALSRLPAHLRDRPARDVHLALLWLAYDERQETPRLLREDGPWWNLARLTGPGTQAPRPSEIVTRCLHGQPGTTCIECYPPTKQGAPATPEAIARIRATARTQASEEIPQ